MVTARTAVCEKIIGSVLVEDTIDPRHRQVGGVPRHVFVDNETIHSVLGIQDNVLAELTQDQATAIAQSKIDAAVPGTKEHFKSALVGYQRVEQDHVFRTRLVTVVSACVKKKSIDFTDFR